MVTVAGHRDGHAFGHVTIVLPLRVPHAIQRQVYVHRIRVAGALIALVVSVAPAAAQQSAGGDDQLPGRFHLGPVRFTPVLILQNVGVDTNVFNEFENPKEDITATVGPGVEYWLRMGRSRLSGKSSLQYLYFRDYASQRSLDVNNEARLEIGLGRVRPFLDGAYLTGRVRPGYEIDARADRTDWFAGGGVDLLLGGRTTLRMKGRERRLAYDATEDLIGEVLARALDRRSTSFGVEFRRKLTPLTTFVVDTEAARDRFVYETARDADTWKVLPGFEFDPVALVGGKVFVGFRQFDTLSPVVPNYTGLIANVAADYRLRATKFDVLATRDVSYSYETLEPYYLQTEVGLKVTQRVTSRWDLVGTIRRYWLDYEQVGGDLANPGRVDKGLRYGGGVRYALTEATVVGLDVEQNERESVARVQRSYEGLRFGLYFSYGQTR